MGYCHHRLERDEEREDPLRGICCLCEKFVVICASGAYCKKRHGPAPAAIGEERAPIKSNATRDGWSYRNGKCYCKSCTDFYYNAKQKPREKITASIRTKDARASTTRPRSLLPSERFRTVEDRQLIATESTSPRLDTTPAQAPFPPSRRRFMVRYETPKGKDWKTFEYTTAVGLSDHFRAGMAKCLTLFEPEAAGIKIHEYL